LPTNPLTHFRPFRTPDTPALAALWNRGVPGAAAAGPLSAHEFDAHVLSSTLFDAAGLVVADRGGRPVGFAHAGFGPESTVDRAGRLATALGTVAMLVVDPGVDDPAVADGLLAGAEAYLRRRGSAVVYAGGQFPLNPFYWGVYGGSEWSGILEAHRPFHQAVARAGYEPVGRTVLLEADLDGPEPRDPRGFLLRRQTRLEVADDATPATWWHALALGESRPTTYKLLDKGDGSVLARATTWDMSLFGRRDGRNRLGLIDVEVATGFRRRGYGRHLVGEVLRQARTQGNAALAVQTAATNLPAQALYASAGFLPVEAATLYRKPGDPSPGP